MKQENKKSKQFCLLVVISIIVTILPVLRAYTEENASLGFSSSIYTGTTLICSIIFNVFILIAIPLFIDRSVAFFENTPRKWWLIWLVFLIMSSVVCRTISRAVYVAQFSVKCTKETKKQALEQGFDMSQDYLFEIERICREAGSVNFDCLNNDGEEKACSVKVASIMKSALVVFDKAKEEAAGQKIIITTHAAPSLHDAAPEIKGNSEIDYKSEQAQKILDSAGFAAERQALHERLQIMSI